MNTDDLFIDETVERDRISRMGDAYVLAVVEASLDPKHIEVLGQEKVILRLRAFMKLRAEVQRKG